METFILLTASYFIGSIPFGLILTKLFLKKDVRNVGSGNIGATNVLRTGSKLLALLTLIFDVGKGYLVTKYALIYYPEGIFLMGLICFLGHIFPVWLKFKGGKGVATFIGFLIGANPLVGFLFLITWIIIALITKYSSLSSVIATLVVPLCFFFINFNYYIIIFFIYLALIIIFKHQENIKRLINKTENKIKLSK